MDNRGRVLGVDACKAGWVGIVLGGGEPEAYVAASISALVGQATRGGTLQVVAIDIPIGLPDAGRRAADVLAKAAIGSLRSSVFMTPVRAALQEPDHATAVAVNRRLAGEGFSIQAFALRPKLVEVEQYVRVTTLRVIEVHPEVSFARMHGRPLPSRKATWAGAEARRRLLADHGIRLSGGLGLAGLNAGVDDVLDAGAAAWTASRYAAGQAISLPDPPEVFSDGWQAAIWI
jgi:predicted RNase H-like nuclease